MKRQCTEWEKIFASDVTNNRLVPKIFKLFMLLDIKKKQQQSQKMERKPEYTLFQEDGQEVHEKMLNIVNHQRNAN